MSSVSSLTLVGLKQERILALGLPLKVAIIILGCILSLLFSDFNALGPISIPTPPTVALTEFYHADTVASVHALPVSWSLISSLCVCLCFCMHIMSTLCSTADAVSSGSWPILFKVLTLNFVCLHFSSFCCLSSVADFTNTEARAPNSAQRAMRFVYGVWVWVMVIFRLLFSFFVLIYRSHPYTWAAVVPGSNWLSWPLSREIHASRTRLGIALGFQRVYSQTFTSIVLLFSRTYIYISTYAWIYIYICVWIYIHRYG